MPKQPNIKEQLKNEAQKLPRNPGVYLYYNSKDEVIYVGKAKNLKSRVSSYFTKDYDNNKTKILVRHIVRFEYIVVETEIDALLLENNLIKKYQPRYNIMLKDDKTYPWICIKNEAFPRVFQTRNIIKDGSKYFGPYTSVRLVRVLTTLFRNLFLLRTCKHNLSDENIKKGKFKVCLEFHINNCKAPCVGQQTPEDYNEQIKQVHNILKGNFKPVKDYLKQIMKAFAENLEYEKAQEVKEKLQILKDYQSKSTVITTTKGNFDVFTIESDEKFAYVNFLKVVDGAIINVHTVEYVKKLNEKDHDILPTAIIDIISAQQFGFNEIDELILPFQINLPIDNLKITIPKIGDKQKLLELSHRNAKYYRLDKIKKRTLVSADRRNTDILLQMKTDLRMKELPVHIECFDNSNIQGTHPVAACVVFKNTKPAKKEYRKFNIKTVEGPDDYASMEEVIYRRYKRLTDEGKSLPQLIIIDGGKGQLNSAVKSLKELDLFGKITVIGIAKRLEEIFFAGDNIPMYLDKNSITLKIIQHARNEAHRFGIEFHRNKRSKTFLNSELENIPGVGEKTIQDLYKVFKSVKEISEAEFENLRIVIGKKRAKVIFNYFKEKKESK
ncbi:MAG: excinuclease ABC subunit UvrC [Bacteroidales bacterium]|nr:excinuclease ABC subunit UvrC [Bacteroidales bacterium]